MWDFKSFKAVMRRSTDPGPVNRKSSTNTTDHVEVVTRPPAQSRLPQHLQLKILSYLDCETLLSAMKVNESFRKAASEIILNRFLALPDLCFASAKRILNDTSGVYGFEGLGRGDAHQYLLDEEYPCEFRIMNDIFITRWTIPDSAFADMTSSGAWVKAFAFTAGERSRWVSIFKLDEIHLRRKAKRAKATSVSAAQELYYLDRSGHPVRGEWTNRKQRAKLVFVPEMDEWYFTWPLAALAGWGIMSEEA